MAEEKFHGVRLVNSDGLPDVTVTAISTVQGRQVFEISTERQKIQFTVSRKGFLRAYPAKKS